MRMNMNKLSAEELSERLRLRSCTEADGGAGRQEMPAEEEQEWRAILKQLTAAQKAQLWALVCRMREDG